jgi:hypothetical protein
MKRTLFFITTIFSISAFAEDDSISSSFNGHYCANPCFYDSIHRPADMLCKFSINENALQWIYKKHKVSKTYTIISQNTDILIIEIDGKENSWYSQVIDGTKYQLSFNKNHGNQFAQGDIEFSVCRIMKSGCQQLESMFIGKRGEYECQETL